MRTAHKAYLFPKERTRAANENSLKKAYTARTFRIPSGDSAQRSTTTRQLAVHLTAIVAAQGALPVKIGER